MISKVKYSSISRYLTLYWRWKKIPKSFTLLKSLTRFRTCSYQKTKILTLLEETLQGFTLHWLTKMWRKDETRRYRVLWFEFKKLGCIISNCLVHISSHISWSHVARSAKNFWQSLTVYPLPKLGNGTAEKSFTSRFYILKNSEWRLKTLYNFWN